ncbi:hypothetical protein ILUMI_23058 [Ignelater luminosus]|uniref:Uncharacterized protein n=1 Tax=Ignelater luminosus TaxID=2038154 RepID=A0A8K0CFD6_IGNLU|nr:hypothetical protein ILUMI_23058 [Ignelater luminosus]
MTKQLLLYCSKCPKKVRKKIQPLNFKLVPTKRMNALASKAGSSTSSTPLRIMSDDVSFEDSSFISSRAETINILDRFVDKMPEGSKEQLDSLLARSFYSGRVSFNLIENEFFKQWMRVLRPSYTPPSRKQLSTKMLDKEYSIVEALTKAEIELAESMTLISQSIFHKYGPRQLQKLGKIKYLL